MTRAGYNGKRVGIGEGMSKGKSPHGLHRETGETEKEVVLMSKLWLLSHVKAANEGPGALWGMHGLTLESASHAVLFLVTPRKYTEPRRVH